MKRALLLVLLLLAAADSPKAQAPGVTMTVTMAASQIGSASVAIPIRKEAVYFGDDGPASSIPAPNPLIAGRSAPPGLWFVLRGWKEGDKARVVVSARFDDKRAPTGFTDTPIATYLLAIGQVVEIAETEKWGASRLFLRATRPE